MDVFMATAWCMFLWPQLDACFYGHRVPGAARTRHFPVKIKFHEQAERLRVVVLCQEEHVAVVEGLVVLLRTDVEVALIGHLPPEPSTPKWRAALGFALDKQRHTYS